MLVAAVFITLVAGRQAEAGNYLADLTKIMRTDWPNNRTVNIVCHGHSVPAGYAQTPTVDTLGAYPNQLREALAKRFPHAVVNVIVTAIGGENSEQGANRFKHDVLALHPDVVTIDYSLNDRGIGLARAKDAWLQMIDESSQAGVKVILMTPTPDQGSNLDDPNDPLNRQAEQVRSLAKTAGVGIVDSLSAFEAQVRAGAPLKSLMAQSNHPNRAGHALVARELERWFPQEPSN